MIATWILLLVVFTIQARKEGWPVWIIILVIGVCLLIGSVLDNFPAVVERIAS